MLLKKFNLRRSKYIVLVFTLIQYSCKQSADQEILPYYNTPSFTPLFISNQEADHTIDHTIGAFSFRDQNNDTITDKNIEGKIHVANFIFTRCISICPVLTKHMKKLQAAFKDNDKIEMLSYSVTPWMDSVPQLHKYALKNEITASNWHLLTGDKSKIYTLARQSYFAEEDIGYSKDSTEFLHTEHIILVDTQKRIRGIYNGTLELDIDQLIKDVRILLKE